MANRSLGVIPAAISLLVSFLSAVTILGTSAEMYSYGAQYFLMIDIAYILALTIIAIFIVPWLHALKLVSINEVSNTLNQFLLNYFNGGFPNKISTSIEV